MIRTLTLCLFLMLPYSVSAGTNLSQEEPSSGVFLLQEETNISYSSGMELKDRYGRQVWADSTGAHTPFQYPDNVFEIINVQSVWPNALYFRCFEIMGTNKIWILAFDNYLDANLCPTMPPETNLMRQSVLAYSCSSEPLPITSSPDAGVGVALTGNPNYCPDFPYIYISYTGYGCRKNNGLTWHSVWGFVYD